MPDTAKYLVHADITADGIVERSDVVGAIFGQTEGLLGDELDLRELQDSSKVGRIDVDINSENGQSFGRITIATSLDRVETAILGAALETIDRVGPCRSTIEVRELEDVRAAKRREVVERAKKLLIDGFSDSMQSSRDLVEEVRESVRIEDITEYEGLPAGPHVEHSDAIIVVEGRSDVLTLLQYGIKNAIAVEGTNVPDSIAELTRSRTVTAFLDGDRGGELIRRELAQVGDIDYVALAPENRCVEDLERHEVMSALREKVPYKDVSHADNGIPPESESEYPENGSDNRKQDTEKETDETVTPRDDGADESASNTPPTIRESKTSDGNGSLGETDTAEETDSSNETEEPAESAESAETAESPTATGTESGSPDTLRGHTRAVIGSETGLVRLLDETFGTIAESDADDAFDLVSETDTVPTAIIIDGELNQRLLDIAAQRGIDHVIAASTGEFVKRPTSVRIRTADQLLTATEA